jgi:hypothetical protein
MEQYLTGPMEIHEDPYNDYNGELQIRRDRRTYEIKSTKSPPTSTTIIKDNKGVSTIYFLGVASPISLFEVT